MKIKIMIVTTLTVVISLLISVTATAYANSTPVYMKEYPSFSIAPMKDSPIKVDKEKLTFKIDEKSSRQAMVTAEYILSNISKENITVPMIFPFISDGYSGFGAEIKFNGEAVDYEIYGVGYIDAKDYLKEPDEFNRQVDIETIIENFNKPPYQTQYFDDTGNATLYKITFDTPSDRQCRIHFKINPDHTRVFTLGFSGFEINTNGACTVFDYVNQGDIGKTNYILVLGEDTLTDIGGNYSDKIEKSTVNIKDFIIHHIVNSEDALHDTENRNMDNYYSMFIREVDRSFENFQLVINHNAVIENMLRYNNISALLYEIEFKANSTNSLTVTYPMTATIDRNKTQNYINTFAYILNPAKNFLEFGEIDIQIELNSKDPYIIDSSIPLNKVEADIYVASFDNLPEKDLVFSTYNKEKITFLDSTTAKLLPRGYMGYIVIFAVLTILIIVIVVLIYRFIVRKRNIR